MRPLVVVLPLRPQGQFAHEATSFFCAMGVFGTVLAITVDHIGILLALPALPTGIYLL